MIGQTTLLIDMSPWMPFGRRAALHWTPRDDDNAARRPNLYVGIFFDVLWSPRPSELMMLRRDSVVLLGISL